MTSSPTSPRRGRPATSTTSAAVPTHGPLNDAGLIGVKHVAADDPAADLRPAGVVDDRAASAADLAEVPRPAVGIPWLTRRAQDANAAQVVRADGLRSVRNQRADDGRRQPEMGDAVAGDEAPQAVRTRVVGGALEQDEPGAEEERPGDRPRAHHPAEVGEPEQRVARPQVEGVGEVLGGLDREAAVDVDRALRLAGRPGGVDEHVGRLGVGGRGGLRLDVVEQARARRVDGLVPPSVALRIPRRRRRPHPEPADDDHPADRRRQGHGLVGDGLHRHDRAAPEEAVRGDEDTGLAIPKSRGDGRGAVAREDRREDRPDPAEGERRDDRLDEHRKEDPDPIAGADAGSTEHARGHHDVIAERGVRQAPDLTVLTLPGDRLAGRVARGARGGRRLGVVESAAAPPAGPLRAAAWHPSPGRAGAATPDRDRRPRRPRTRPDRRRLGPGGLRGLLLRWIAGSRRAVRPRRPPGSGATRHPERRGRRSGGRRASMRAYDTGRRASVRR